MPHPSEPVAIPDGNICSQQRFTETDPTARVSKKLCKVPGPPGLLRLGLSQYVVRGTNHWRVTSGSCREAMATVCQDSADLSPFPAIGRWLFHTKPIIPYLATILSVVPTRLKTSRSFSVLCSFSMNALMYLAPIEICLFWRFIS